MRTLTARDIAIVPTLDQYRYLDRKQIQSVTNRQRQVNVSASTKSQFVRALTTRDVSILIAVSNYRCLDRDQVEQLFSQAVGSLNDESMAQRSWSDRLLANDRAARLDSAAFALACYRRGGLDYWHAALGKKLGPSSVSARTFPITVSTSGTTCGPTPSSWPSGCSLNSCIGKPGWWEGRLNGARFHDSRGSGARVWPL